MPIPLLSDTNKLAHAAASLTPRFAAILATNADASSVVVARHAVQKDVFSLFPAEGSVVSQWALNTAKYAALGLTTAGAIAAVEVAGTQMLEEVKSLTSRRMPAVQAIYDRLIGEAPSIYRVRGATEQLEDLKPADAGKTSSVVERSTNYELRQEYEALLLSAAIVSVGFEAGPGGAKGSSGLDNSVYNNVREALNVVAPGKLLSELSAMEMHAVATTATYAANNAYLEQMQSEEPYIFDANRLASQKLLSAAKGIPAAATFARQFMEEGAFSRKRYLTALPEPVDGVDPKSVVTATPSEIQAGLLRASTSKAVAALASVEPMIRGQQPSTSAAVWAKKNILAVAKSLTDKNERLEMAPRPIEHDAPSM